MLSEEVIDERVGAVFRQVMNVEYTRAMKMDEVEEWDSLAHTQLMMALEEAFQIEFRFEDAIRMVSGEAVAACIRTTLARQSA
jgi:acyl carrier protein